MKTSCQSRKNPGECSSMSVMIRSTFFQGNATPKPFHLIFLLWFSTTTFAFEIPNPIEEGVNAAKDLNPFEFSSTTTNHSGPTAPPEPQSPCEGKTIRPDSAGNFMFSVQPGGAKKYAIEFSKNGVNWSDPINGAMGLEEIQGQQIPVNAGKLLLISKNWHWRTKAEGGGKTIVSKHSCKIAIEPSGGAQMLTPPILISPACGSQVMGNMVMFDAKPGGGTFQIFRAELQYNRMVGGMPGNWTNSGLLTSLDKNLNKFGMAVPVSELARHSGKWRWRARLDHEKMPLFGNLSQGEWSPWCEFSVPMASRPAVGVTPAPGNVTTMPAPIMAPPQGSPVIVTPPPVPAGRALPPPPQPVIPAGSAQPMPALPNLPAVQQTAERRRR